MKQADIQKAFDDLNAKYLQALKDLDSALDKIQEQQSMTAAIDPDFELRNAAKVMSQSELNKEDLSEDEIYQKLKTDTDASKKIGFWAMPLPKDSSNPTMKYTGKPR